MIRSPIRRERPRVRSSMVPVSVAAFVLLGSLVPVPDAIGATASDGVSLSIWFHLVGYGALALALSRHATRERTRLASRPAFGIVLLVTAYGVSVETIQFVVPYRHFSVVDIGVNALGATAAIVVRAIVDRFHSRWDP